MLDYPTSRPLGFHHSGILFIRKVDTRRATPKIRAVQLLTTTDGKPVRRFTIWLLIIDGEQTHNPNSKIMTVRAPTLRAPLTLRE